MREDKSIIAVILEAANPVLLEDLRDDEHEQCLEYYAALLAIRDREEITKILCKQTPDLLTQAVREAVAGMDPIIRAIHNKVDLSDHVKDYQSFLDQLIATSKPKKGKAKNDPPTMPTVEDYVQLLRNNQMVLYKWLHAVSKNCPDVASQFRKWAKDSLAAFHKGKKGGENIEDQLCGIFNQVPDSTKTTLLPVIDAHAAYLRELESFSNARMQAIIEGSSSSMTGPGVYLVRWQSLLDETPITPSNPVGPIRQGKDVKAAEAQGKRGSVTSDAGEITAKLRAVSLSALPEAPDVKPVVDALAPMFKQILQASARDNGPANDHAVLN